MSECHRGSSKRLKRRVVVFSHTKAGFTCIVTLYRETICEPRQHRCKAPKAEKYIQKCPSPCSGYFLRPRKVFGLSKKYRNHCATNSCNCRVTGPTLPIYARSLESLIYAVFLHCWMPPPPSNRSVLPQIKLESVMEKKVEYLEVPVGSTHIHLETERTRHKRVDRCGGYRLILAVHSTVQYTRHTWQSMWLRQTLYHA